jgi:hypothetical protein
VPSSQSAKVEPAPPSSQVPSMAKLGLPTHVLEQMQPGICGAGGACGCTDTLKPAIGQTNEISKISQLWLPLHVDDLPDFLDRL